MIFLFHGDNQQASRNALHLTVESLKKQFPSAEFIQLNGGKLAETELVEALEASSFFSAEKIIQIEGLLSRRPSKEKDHLINRLIQAFSIQHSEFSILLWEPKQTTPAQLKKFQKMPAARIQEFKLPKTLYKFLDSLVPNSPASPKVPNSVTLFEETIKTEPVELVMYMMLRRISELILATGGPDALKSMRFEWQKAPLLRQANAWKPERLVEVHRKIIEIDEAIKTGATTADLRTHLDILLSTL